MFASNMALLEKNILTKMTKDVGDQPEIVFPERLNRLFEAMSVGDKIAMPPIKRFNGGLFDGRRNNLKIESTLMPLIREADELDLSQIEPAIFGTLFERIYNPAKRAQQGRHYTSRKDIETLVEPVVMAPLRRDLGQHQIWNQCRRRRPGKGHDSGLHRSIGQSPHPRPRLRLRQFPLRHPQLATYTGTRNHPLGARKRR